MVGQFLPDTNVLIYGLKGIEPYASFLTEMIVSKSMHVSSIVVAEYLEGATDRDEMNLKIIMNSFGVLPVDRLVAEIGAKYKKTYSQKTKKVRLSDCLIAATCKANDLILVTADKHDYPMEDIEVKVLV